MPQYPSNKYDPMASEGKIELDFPALRFWWKNGDSTVISEELDDASKAELRKKLGVSYYGGWCAHRKDADEVLPLMEKLMPSNCQLITMASKKKVRFEVYAARQLTICPILKRVAWFKPEDDPKTRPYSRHEILVLLAVPDANTKTFVPWGLAVLSGRSTSGLAIVNTIAAWGRKIEKAIDNLEKHPIWAHWITLGTIRNDIYVEMRGKGNNVSPITPCEYYLPEDKIPLNDFIAKRYIGDDLQTYCIEYRDMSMAWAEYWNEREGPMEETASNEAPDNIPPEPYAPEQANSDIPF